MPDKKLAIGDAGQHVARLHEQLRARGYTLSPDELVGAHFGPSTRDAVLDLQSRHGLAATGAVDRVTAALLATPAPLTDASTTKAADLAGHAEVVGPSEFERHLQALKPHLAGADIAELSEDKIVALQQETGIDRGQLDLLAQAVRLGRQVDRLAGVRRRRPAAKELDEAEILYGLLREGTIGDPAARSDAQIEAAARRSVEAGVVSPAAAASARDRLDQLKRIGVLLPSASPRGSLGDVLGTLPRGQRLTDEQQVRFADFRAAFGDGDALWQTVANSDLGPRLAPLKRTVLLEQLTGSHVPLMQALQKRPDAADDATGAFLAAVRPREWRELARAHGAPEGESPGGYAERLQTDVERRYPAAALRARLESGDIEVKPIPVDAVRRFLTRNPDFDFAAPDFEAQLTSRHAEGEDLRRGLGAFRRTLGATGGRIDAAAALIEAGLDSSFAISNLGPDRFKARMGKMLPGHVVEDVQKAADEQVLTAVALHTARGNAFKSGSGSNGRSEAPRGPTLRSLFGDTDFCECSHCRSVLGPAAYLADLLHFLETSTSNTDGTATVLTSLAARRPDLRHLELSCENTNTEIPYTDLVLETLENAVALPLLIAGGDLPGTAPDAVTTNLTSGAGIPFVNLPTEIQDALRRTAIRIGEKVSVELLRLSSGATFDLEWAISDGSRRWELTQRPEQLKGWRELPGGPEVLSIGGFDDTAGVVADLKTRNRLHDELTNRLAPAWQMPLKSSALAANVQTPSGAQGWRATFVREVVLQFPALGNGAVKLLYADDQLFQETDIIDYLSLSFAQQALNAKAANPATSVGANLFWSFALAKLNLPVSIDLATVATVPPPPPGGGGILVGPRYRITATESFLLEVTSPALTVTALAYQNSSILSHLEAQPENRNPEAYRRLRAAYHPWSLPFDLPLEETRAFLDKVGTARRTLIEMALPPGPMTDLRAAEVLGLSMAERPLVAAPPAGGGPSLWDLWGVKAAENRMWDERAGLERMGSGREVLSWASMVMQQSRLTYRELLDVLQTSFLADARPNITPEDECEPSKLQVTGADLETALERIHRFVRVWRRTGWTMRELDRALVVFDRRLDDAALRGLALMRLLHERLRVPIVRLAAVLGSIEIAAWTQNTAEGAPVQPSLYEQLFQQSALRTSPSFERFKLDASGRLPTPVFGAGGEPAAADTIAAHAPFIASAIGVSPQDVIDLSRPRDVILFGTLSSLLGAATLARALRLSVRDYLRWVAVVGGQGPFAAQGVARAEALLAFAEQLAFARNSGKSLDELEYLLLHKTEGTFSDADARTADAARSIRSALRAGEVLGAASASNLSTQLLRAGAPAPFAAAVTSETALSELLWAEIGISVTLPFTVEFPAAIGGRFYCNVDEANSTARFGCRGFIDDAGFDALEQAPSARVPISSADRRALRRRYGLIRAVVASQLQNRRSPRFEAPVAQPGPAFALAPDLGGCLRYESTKGLTLSGLLTSAQATLLKVGMPATLATAVDQLVNQSSAFTSPADPAVGLAALQVPQALGTEAEGAALERALSLLAPWLELDLLSAEASAFSGLSPALCRNLLDRIKVGGGATAATVLLAPAFLSGSTAAAAYPEQAEALTRLRKAALLLADTPDQTSELGWLFGGTFTVLDVNQLPTQAGAAPGSFTAWRAYRELLQAMQSTPDGRTVLTRLDAAIAATDADERNRTLAAAFELPTPAQVAEACAADLLNIGWPELKQPGRLLQLFALLNVCRRLGCAPGVLKRLLAASPTDDDAAVARKLFMSNFDSETLPARLEQVSNVMRARQRDALIDCLRSRDRLRQADDLLDYYLIDVQMGTCMRTSRMKQAISSVQLFVQRCLLGLERGAALPVKPEHINARRWKWMQNYRVWEANRKVFLFPENWIEPDLRDDKTEVFRAFESELLQEDLTHERAVGAFRSYVEGLAEVARPVIVSVWHQLDAAGRRRVHVAARDRGTPHKFYYRRAVLTPGLGARWAVDWTPWERIDAEFPSGHVMVSEMDGMVYLLSPAINRDEQDGWRIHMEALRRTEAGWVSLKRSRDSFTHVLVPNKSIAQSFVFRPLLVQAPFGKTVQVLCFRAIVQRDERVPLRNEGRLTVNSPTSYDPRLPQLTTLDVRILEHFKDTANQNADTYQLSPNGFTLTARFDVRWFYRDVVGNEHELDQVADPNTWTNAFTFNDNREWIPTDRSPAYAKPARCLESLSLSGLMDNTRNNLIQIQSFVERGFGSLKAPIYYKVGRIQEIELKVDVPSGLGGQFTNATFIQNIPLANYGNSGTIELDFVLHYKDGFVPARAHPDRQLEFERAGAFEFDEARALIYLTPEQAPPTNLDKDPPLEGCEYFDSGYLRRPPRTPSGQPRPETPLRLRSQAQTLLDDSDNGFFAVKANGPDAGWDSMRPIGAYSDSRFVLFFIAEADKYLVLANGGTWVWAGLRELADRNWDAAELERMPAPVSGAAAALIPLRTGSALIDFEASTKAVDLAFDRGLPASPYDWEAFFHAPLLIATQLSLGQRFAEARGWFHTIFDPTSDRPAPANLPAEKQEAVRYWRFPPFREAALQDMEVDDLLEAYASGTLPTAERARLENNIRAWKDNPFNPHLVARYRVRSYMWAVVIKYAQNHLAWADQLYRRDTMESINEATQLYVLVARLLGPRPQSAPRPATPARTYAYLAGPLMDELSNVWLQWETLAPARPPSGGWIARDTAPVELLPPPGARFPSPPLGVGGPTVDLAPPAGIEPFEAVSGVRSIASLYFCIPSNAELGSLWDTVEDRLFKIRHCMNIDGVERQLPLFEPPIDPALLVRAVAAGLDIADVVAGLGAPLPLHRFPVMLAKAQEICADLRALGASALAALEKRDAEELARLRNDHELALLKLTEQVRQQQIAEADMTLQGLGESRRTAEERLKHYQRLLDRRDLEIPEPGDAFSLAPIVTPLAKSGLEGKEQGLGISQTELDQITRLEVARAMALRGGVANTIGGVLLTIGGILSSAPRGSSPGPTLGDLGGGLTGAGQGFNAAASAYQAAAGYLSATAGIDAIIGGYERRRDDWILQTNMALREIAQIDKQSAAAQLRKEIAEKELTNLRKQVENAKAVDSFLKSKYSSAQLYRFMSNQLVTLHYRFHQLAVDVARRAERCFQFELGQPKASFVKPTYWDAPRKGLLSGEQLQFDLRRMDLAYLENNKRDHEMTRHISLLEIDPVALISLRQTGRCEFEVPELLYDMDCPGHYMRRIRSVSLTIPCVAGPYTGVHCKLTLLRSSIRRDPTGQDYAREPDDPRFVDDYSAVQSIVTSGAQDDAGLFEPTFRDERYLPFEGAGAIATWRLELPSRIRPFDYDTISDVVLHVRYTARDGGARSRQQAELDVEDRLEALAPVRLFSVRHEFPSEWGRFKGKAGTNDLVLKLKPEHYPLWARGAGPKSARGVSEIDFADDVMLFATKSAREGVSPSRVTAQTSDAQGRPCEAQLQPDPAEGNLLIGPLKLRTPAAPTDRIRMDATGEWTLRLESSIEDLWIAVRWGVSRN